ncbi:hypothetical protein M8C21_009978, partial [Ambrosia artemisiifolia]
MYFDYRYHGTSFEQSYRCYPASFIDKAHIENGDKIIMPPSALDRLASLQIDYPMLFELRNASTERVSHCGVLEFIAEEGLIYMPYWMMENLLLQEGDIVRVKNVTLPKGTYVKLQPHTSDFLNISNPKAILETTLRNFSCLTTGDSIMVAYNNKKYYINIIESKPSNAISIIETDCEVDFAPPLDYKEPERPVSSVPKNKAPEQDEAAPAAVPKFNPFTGSGRRLDGKPLKDQPPAVSTTSASNGKQPAVSSSGVGRPSSGSSSQSSSRQSQGKLVFGSAPKNQKEVTKDMKQEQPAKEEAKFQAFTGKKYSLKGCKEAWNDWFSTVEDWAGQQVVVERIAWLKIYGVPIHIAEIEVMNSIAALFGEVIQQAFYPEEGDMSFAMVGVLVKSQERLNGKCKAVWKDGSFMVHVEEDFEAWVPDCIGVYEEEQEQVQDVHMGDGADETNGLVENSEVTPSVPVENDLSNLPHLNGVFDDSVGGGSVTRSCKRKGGKFSKKKGAFRRSMSPLDKDRPKKRIREDNDMFDIDRLIFANPVSVNA